MAADYELQGGLRRVSPYLFEFAVPVKGRWVGHTLLDHFASEFPHYPREYYARKIADGWITLNGQPASPNDVLQLGQSIGHLLHRHEQPVADAPLRILKETADYLVIDKPASLPVHPCGRFRKNTVLHVLHADHGLPLQALHPVHRLDRLTSGVLALGRSATEAARIGKQILEHGQTEDATETMKTYLARVRGCFPEEEVVVSRPIVCVDRRRGVYGCAEATPAAPSEGDRPPAPQLPEPTGAAEEAPREAIDGDESSAALEVGSTKRRPKLSKEERERKRQCTRQRVSPKEDAPKPAVTAFRRFFYDAAADQSVVYCYPRTGRTHQIRLHLQLLGHPIANDPVYGGTPGGAVGEDAGPSSPLPSSPAVEAHAWPSGCQQAAPSSDGAAATTDCDFVGAAQPRPGHEEGEGEEGKDSPSEFEYEFESTAFQGTRKRSGPRPIADLLAGCQECLHPDPDPPPGSLRIFLHALRLELELGGRRECIEAPYPDWASPPQRDACMTATNSKPAS